MLTKEQLNMIKERVAKATPGEWFYDSYTVCTDEIFDGDGGLIETVTLDYTDRHGDVRFKEETDAQFVAHARQDVPALVAEVERLQKANRKRAEIIEEQNKELNNFRMDKLLMDFGISKERVRVVEKEKIPNKAFRNRKRQVKHLTKGCIRRNAEIKRLREALQLIQNSDGWLVTPEPICTVEQAYFNCVEIADNALGGVQK